MIQLTLSSLSSLFSVVSGSISGSGSLMTKGSILGILLFSCLFKVLFADEGAEERLEEDVLGRTFCSLPILAFDFAMISLALETMLLDALPGLFSFFVFLLTPGDPGFESVKIPESVGENVGDMAIVVSRVVAVESDFDDLSSN